ncbi:MAG TPA: FkbM family methyltransferase [Flavisolibacter sp.]
MNEYALYIGPKTRFLNFFRRVFTIPFVEYLLVKKMKGNHHRLWEKLIPPNYLYKSGSLRKTKIDGVAFLLDISNVVEHLAYFRIAPEKFELVQTPIQTATIIFDIGANIGSTALAFARENPGAKVFAFEPHPVTFQRAKTNIGLNHFDNIHLENKGLGAVKETKKLYQVIDNNPGMNRFMPGDSPYPFVHVEITTLDAFCLEHQVGHIDFMKVDVEGFEYFVLAGGRSVISRSHPVIYLELYDHGLKKNGYSARALISLLYDMGYNFVLNAYTNRPIDESTDLTDCDFDIIAERK